MTTKVVGLAFLAALVMLAPLAAAEADSGNTTDPERPDDAAWVEDCPPDMMCAYSDAPNGTDDGNASAGSERPDDAAWVEDCPPDMMCAYSDAPREGDDANVTRGPEDCAYCRMGPDDCIDCAGMPVPADDDTTWGTDCPPGVYCMSDGAPDDAGAVPASAQESEEASALGVVAVAAVGILGLAYLTRRR